MLYMLQTIFLQTFGKGDNETSRHHLTSYLRFTYTQAPNAVFLHQLPMLSRLLARPSGVDLVERTSSTSKSKMDKCADTPVHGDSSTSPRLFAGRS